MCRARIGRKNGRKDVMVALSPKIALDLNGLAPKAVGC